MRVLVLSNPRSGAGESRLPHFTEALSRSGAEVTTRHLADLGSLSDTLADTGSFDRVVAAGGDGTVSAIAWELRGTGTPILVYPAGTANLIALNLGMPADAAALARAAIAGKTVNVDIGELSFQPARASGIDDSSRSTGFLMAAGAGFDARVMESAAGLKSMMGPAAYLVAALQNLNPTVSRFTLDLDGECWESEGIAVLLANFTRIQMELPVVHQTDATDGLMDVVILQTKNVPELLPGMWAVVLDRLGSFAERPGLEVRQARRVEVYADPPLPLESDGEPLGASTPLVARMHQLAATFIIP